MKYLLVSLMFLGCAHVANKPISLAGHVGVAVATQTEADKIINALQSEVAPVREAPTGPNGPVMLELDAFDDSTITGLETKINQLHQSDTEIYLRVNSNGGSVFGMMNLIQFLEKQPVICINDFRAYSAAAYFIESPACKERWATKRSTMLWHEALTPDASGNAHSLRDTANELEALTDSIISVTSERMKMTEEDFKAKINNCVWIVSWKDMLKYHAIDKIIDPATLPVLTTFEKPQSLIDLLLGKK